MGARLSVILRHLRERKRRRRHSTFEDLPSLIHLKILLLLDFDDSLNCRSVSKCMRTIVDNNLNLTMTLSSENYPTFRIGRLPFQAKCLIVREFNTHFGKQKGLSNILRIMFPCVTVLDIKEPVNYENYFSLMVACRLLVDLRLHADCLAGDAQLYKIQTHCNTLKHLSIHLACMYTTTINQSTTQNLSSNLIGILEMHNYPALQTFHLKLIPPCDGWQHTTTINLSLGLLLKFTNRQKNLSEVTFNLPQFQPLNPSNQAQIFQSLKEINFKLNLKVNYLHPSLAAVLTEMGIVHEGKPFKTFWEWMTDRFLADSVMVE